MATLYILCGPSGSGKSTWGQNSKNIKEGHYEYVSRDNIRFSLLKEGEDYFSREDQVFNIFAETIAKCLKISGTAVVADATHINVFSRRKLLQAIDTYIKEYEIIYVVFNTDVDTCISRNSGRSGQRKVPEEVIRNMCKKFHAPTMDEDDRIKEIIEV